MTSASRDNHRLSDPLAYALLPPPNETPVEYETRLDAERAAKKISDGIDEEIRTEQEAIQRKLRRRTEVRVLLLGQSESGKSTTLKQFQLAYAPNAFREERFAWRSVIYLNLVQSVRRIIEALSPPDTDVVRDPDEGEESFVTRSGGRLSSESFALQPSNTQPSSSPQLSSPRYSELKLRLAPLLALEQQLVKELGRGEDDEATQLARPAPISNPALPSPAKGKNRELSVSHRNNWKKALNMLTSGGGKTGTSEPEGLWNDPTDAALILDQCRADIEELWGDEEVQASLRKNRIRLEESSGFYLDSLPRITARRYVPSDDDILKARLKTIGVVEYTFPIKTGNERGVDWKIFDVGGARNQRQVWAPYFQDMNAIIFLAPISAFDQVLAEDARVNRVDDSLQLWRSLVSNKLLSNVSIVLFLNKCDLLMRKLAAGVRLDQYRTSYGDQPNDFESVTKYFSNKFRSVNRSYSSNRSREVYVHLTSVTDTHGTSSILNNVRNIIFRNELRQVNLL